MNAMTVQRRGDLAEEMLPVAARLAVLVHGEGGPQDVQETLAGLDEAQKSALIVVLAGLVDPEQPLTVPRWDARRSVRGLAAEWPAGDDGGEAFDQVAVERYAAGDRVVVSDEERLAAVVLACSRGLSYPDLDTLHGIRVGATSSFVSRLRKRYRAQGRPFPEMRGGTAPGRMTDEQVVEAREVYARGGVTDLELALRYGMTRKAMSEILSGRSRAAAGGSIRGRGTARETSSRNPLFHESGYRGVQGAGRASGCEQEVA